MKSIRFEEEPSVVIVVDLDKTPLSFERKKRAGSFESMLSSVDTSNCKGQDGSTHNTSTRRYRRERQKSSMDLHKTFAQAA